MKQGSSNYHSIISRKRLALLAAVAVTLAPALGKADDSLDAVKKEVAAAIAPVTNWDGPTTGPKAQAGKSVVFVSLTQNSSGNADSARGVEEAAKVLGWKFSLIDGRGTATGGADALNQAIALKPDGIVLGSVSIENNKAALKQASDAGIVIVGWHATDKPGPIADPKVFTNVSTDPYKIAHMAGLYAVAHSNGTAGAEVISDRQYPIVVTKTNGIEDAIKACSGCTLLSEDNGPFGEVPQRTPALTNSLLQRFGNKLGYMLTFNDVYFDFVVPTLRGAGIEPGQPPYLISAGDGSVSAYQRIRDGKYQIATVPEPAMMQGWQVADELNRAFAGQPPSGYETSVHLVTKENVDADGGDKNRFDPSNDYRGHYKSIWGVQ
jgi:ribose transport system substrate-binding protein